MFELEITQDKVYRQGLVRLLIWLIASIYFGIGFYRGQYDYGLHTFALFCTAFAGFSFLPLLVIRYWPVLYLWVYAGLLVDLSANALAMLLTGGADSPFFLVYLWIIVGYLSRYGVGALLPVTLLSLVSFSVVVPLSGDWERIPLEIGFQYLALGLLPVYMQSLLGAVIKARAEADQANRAKSRFLANMSHEIRTPLSGLVGTAELLRLTSLDGLQRHYVDNLKSSANTLRALVDDILDFSKIEAGKLSLDEHLFRFDEVIEEVKEVMTPLAVDKGLRLRTEVIGRLPNRLFGDSVRLRQVLFNLVGNAIKFTADGEVVIRISAMPGSDPARRPVRIEVEDTGIGIPASQLGAIFDSFTQVGGREHHGGTGLGTTISRELVRLMGGRIGVRSREGVGSTFWFEVPWRLPAAGDAGAASTGAAISAPAAAEGPPPEVTVIGDAPRVVDRCGRILVADDDPINCEVVATLLRKAGYPVDVVGDGEQALAVLARGEVRLAFVDGRMPKVGGIEVAERWRQTERETGSGAAPVFLVALTANATAEDERRYRQAGFDEFLSKPVSPDRLFEVCRVLCGEQS